jgi:hypothetical protein
MPGRQDRYSTPAPGGRPNQARAAGDLPCGRGDRPGRARDPLCGGCANAISGRFGAAEPGGCMSPAGRPPAARLPPAGRRAVPAGRTEPSRRTGHAVPPSAGPYSSITDAAARAAPALPGHQRTGVPVGYPQAAYLVLPAESIRMITNQYEKVHVSALRPGLRNFARMLGPGRYGSRAGGADGPPLPKQPRRHSTATRPPMPQCCKNQCRKSRCGKNQRPGYHGPGDTQGS